MRKAERLFELIQILRTSRKPITAGQIGEILEVSSRTIYRDIASLQAMRVPIAGEAGIGYIMRPGYDLPPPNFDIEEIEAMVVGLSLLNRTGDTSLQKAARRIYNKLEGLRTNLQNLHVDAWGADPPGKIELSEVRNAIRTEQKIRLEYFDQHGVRSERIILPVAMVYYVEVIVIAAWCELREAFRHFRADRVHACQFLDETFIGEGSKLREQWKHERGGNDETKRPKDYGNSTA